MPILPREQTALAAISNQSSNQGYRPRLIEFYGYEGEDFRHFQEILESYLAISNTNSDGRKLVILKSQLRRAAKVYFERVILKNKPDITYDQAIEELKKQYITPELIQNYELEFSEMYQGNQEHPRIFLARLREAADLANIDNEAIIESRFRAGLLKEIKQFCIQSSSRNFQEWINHADGWWNAHRPRKIAMVDNPFIPRNINNALIYHDDDIFNERHNLNNHNVEIVDTDERSTNLIPINDIRNNIRLGSAPIMTNTLNGSKQLSALEVSEQPNDQYYRYRLDRQQHSQHNHQDNQQGIYSMIQKAIRNELNAQSYNNGSNSYNQNDGNGYNNYRHNNYSRSNHGNGYGNIYNSNGYNNQNRHNNGNSNQFRNGFDGQPQQTYQNQNQIPERPPEVKSVPYTTNLKEKSIRKPITTKRVTTRKQLGELKSTSTATPQNITPPNTNIDTDLPMEEVKRKTPRRKSQQPVITYDIVSEVLDQPARISVRDLITTTPKFRRDLASACRIRRKSVEDLPQQTIAQIEDDDINTTAVYSKLNIGNKRIRALVDCGAAKTCMSKALADALNLNIDAASESVFTLGNGTKQPALGVIYDVPIEVKDSMTIPCIVEVLPSCPSHLIIGNNWLNRAKARIDFNSSSLKVFYKNQKAELPISFLRKQEAVPRVTSYTQTYQNPISLTNSTTKHVHFENENSEEDTEETSTEEEIEEYSSEDEEGSSEEEEQDSLLILEDDLEQDVNIEETDQDQIVRASKEGMILYANTSNTFHLEKPPHHSRNITYSFEVTNKNILQVMGYFDLNTSIIINKKSIDVHIYNRFNQDIYLKPNEEIGRLEKFNLQSEDTVQGYQFNRDVDLFALEHSSKHEQSTEEETIAQETYSKLEVGKVDQRIEKKLRTLIHKYEEIFDWNNDTIGYTHLISHKIVIEENKQPISHMPYRLSPVESEYLQKELNKYCKLGVISPSNSPWAAPVILVKKKNGEYRMVIDYRKLNAITKKDSYPLPRIDDLLDTLGKAKIFSALDMRSGFHQVPMEENTYIDDLNIYSNNPQEHLTHLEQVFNCIKIANLKLNPEKCFFFKDHLKFLGYIVTKDGLKTDPSKIEKIQSYPIPKTLTQIRGFLGLASYYRRFIQNFAAIARPLHDQTKTSKKIPWSTKTTESFEKLKKMLTEAPILARPDFDKDFILVTDASRLGLGCILTQLDENGHEHPIIYASRSLKSSEVNYGVSKLECLAVIWAVKLFRPYLLGRKFIVITDHSALKGLLNTTNPTGIIARWITILTEYEYDIKYRPGRINESADFLSRLGY
ncbi:hypothetical protein RO3G_04685 [Rhizopus delemar RA 99-880]|uniref:RNA-directed DNA polymerase n=1 Tax=Rhizopus delemar (strain RA 99-880 / ATCC MYA-4621 / FGSC 9543 / NRRL 43880) TaxID=246409 RepID=I1BUV0_RHIO9|nr:hypothetical protein RO3G_04685 [Rhizopus delemar RA 99-880]|eukprot:EIE79980.1 hypothetical protein RO3G_04685 [Rhizopus delemar RA 99-880]